MNIEEIIVLIIINLKDLAKLGAEYSNSLLGLFPHAVPAAITAVLVIFLFNFLIYILECRISEQ